MDSIEGKKEKELIRTEGKNGKGKERSPIEGKDRKGKERVYGNGETNKIR